ncbi:MAG: hypothetical protein R3B07_00875 [Polyangiaceae bacterium]
MNALQRSLGAMADGNLTGYITEQYRGDHAALSEAFEQQLEWSEQPALSGVRLVQHDLA